jgi:uncharacterized protein (DUF433 family)
MNIKIEPLLLPLRITPQGAIMVGGTRVPLDTVISEYLDGNTPEQIVLNFDSLRLADVYFAIGYYLLHRAEIDSYLAKRREESDQMRESITSQPEYRLLVDRILARATESSSTTC